MLQYINKAKNKPIPKPKHMTNQINTQEWLKISEEYYDQILEAVPPIDMTGSKFICSEPYSDNDDGFALYFVGCINGSEYFGRHMTYKEYLQVRPELITSEKQHESIMLETSNRKAYQAYLEDRELPNNEDSRDQFDDRYKGEYDSQQDYAEQNYQDYYPEDLPDWARLHLDFEMLGLTLFCNFDIYYLKNLDGHKIYVFNN